MIATSPATMSVDPSPSETEIALVFTRGFSEMRLMRSVIAAARSSGENERTLSCTKKSGLPPRVTAALGLGEASGLVADGVFWATASAVSRMTTHKPEKDFAADLDRNIFMLLPTYSK